MPFYVCSWVSVSCNVSQHRKRQCPGIRTQRKEGSGLGRNCCLLGVLELMNVFSALITSPYSLKPLSKLMPVTLTKGSERLKIKPPPSPLPLIVTVSSLSNNFSFYFLLFPSSIFAPSNHCSLRSVAPLSFWCVHLHLLHFYTHRMVLSHSRLIKRLLFSALTCGGSICGVLRCKLGRNEMEITGSSSLKAFFSFPFGREWDVKAGSKRQSVSFCACLFFFHQLHSIWRCFSENVLINYIWIYDVQRIPMET